MNALTSLTSSEIVLIISHNPWTGRRKTKTIALHARATQENQESICSVHHSAFVFLHQGDEKEIRLEDAMQAHPSLIVSIVSLSCFGAFCFTQTASSLAPYHPAFVFQDDYFNVFLGNTSELCHRCLSHWKHKTVNEGLHLTSPPFERCAEGFYGPLCERKCNCRPGLRCDDGVAGKMFLNHLPIILISILLVGALSGSSRCRHMFPTSLSDSM